MKDPEFFPEKNRLSWRTKLCYGVGHILNDLCASMWFTYLLVYYNKVIQFSSVKAGTLLLIGQIVDGICTPLVGIQSDRTKCVKYGKRKIWHLIGVISVLVSFPFIFNVCLGEFTTEWKLFAYYTPFIVIFQFGWAATQISHLSLIPELTEDDREKVTLNAIRYACTVASNTFIYVMMWYLLKSSKASEIIGPSYAPEFRNLVFIAISVGGVFMIIFHVGVKEKPSVVVSSHEASIIKGRNKASNWMLWFKEVQFYQIGGMYMATRLVVNISMVYTPIFLTGTLNLDKSTIAIIPLVIYISGFLSSFFIERLNQWLGRKVTFFNGIILVIMACLWTWFLKEGSSQVYFTAALLGIGGSTMLVTSLTMTADLIGDNTETGAFVYGAMSFADKFSNGIAVEVIQVVYDHKSPGLQYYRYIMTFVVGASAVVALFALLTILKNTIGKSSGATHDDITKSLSMSQSATKGSLPVLRYKPSLNNIKSSPAQVPQTRVRRSLYGSMIDQNISFSQSQKMFVESIPELPEEDNSDPDL